MKQVIVILWTHGLQAWGILASACAKCFVLQRSIDLVNTETDAMMKLYDSAFSPFARKVRMVLEHKGLDFEAVDGLLKANHEALKKVNRRIEVPALVDGDIVIVNSADIVGYLEFRYPVNPVYPQSPEGH